MADKIINLQYTTIKDPLPDFIYKNLEKYSQEANSYHPQPLELIERLAERHQIPKEMVYVTAGCDEAIQMFIHAFGERTYTFTPTYIVYSDAKEFGNKFTELYSLNNNKFDISTEKIKNATLIFLANPNNPSGFTEKCKVMELIENNTHAKVIIDEAYGDFAELSVIDQVIKYSNMAVLRSFSKGFGMAGNRIGYIIANPEVLSVVKNKAQWSNVSYLSIGAAIIALENEKYFENMRSGIAEVRDDIMDFLRSNGYDFLPSKINAVVIKFANEMKGTIFFNYLKDNGIVASHGNGFSNIGLDNSFVRIAVGNKNQMKKFKESLQKL